MLLTSVAIGIVFAGAALMMIGSEAKAKPMAVIGPSNMVITSVPNPQVQAILNKVSSKNNPTSAQINDAIRSIRSMMRENVFRNSADYWVASVVASKGSSEEDALLAHDLAACSLAMGDPRAKEMLARSTDQFLTRAERQQRFGTQVKNGKVAPTSPTVPDSIRYILGVPSLREAKDKAAPQNAKYNERSPEERSSLSQSTSIVIGPPPTD